MKKIWHNLKPKLVRKLQLAEFLELFKVPQNSGIVTPSVLRAIRISRQSTCYLHPYPLVYDIVDNDNLTLLQLSLTSFRDRRLVPWWISTVLIIGILGTGSCAFVVLGQLFGLELKAEVRFYHTFLFLALGCAALFELGVWCLLIQTGQQFSGTFNSYLGFEKER